MGRPRADQNRESTPTRILNAAGFAFADLGFEARLSDIAAKAGIRRPSLLYHFKNKETLYGAVIEEAFDQLGTSLRLGRSAEGTFTERLEAATRAFTEFVESHPDVARLVVREMLADEGPGTEMLMGQIAPLLDEMERWIVTEGADVIDPDVPVRAVLLQIVSDTLLRCASGAVREALWGTVDFNRTWSANRRLFMSHRMETD